MNMFVCSICGNEFVGYGNNPWPVTKGEDDRCCDDCNSMYVIPARIANMVTGKQSYDITRPRKTCVKAEEG